MTKKVLKVLASVVLMLSLAVLMVGCSGTGNVAEQPAGSAEPATLGEYSVEIKSCRLAKDFQGEDVVIVLYSFTNNAKDPASFGWTFEDAVYQDGVGLNEAYVLADNANYSMDNQTKEIKSGATLEVEVAYELNDTTTDIEVEVKELISFSDDVIKKTFKIAK